MIRYSILNAVSAQGFHLLPGNLAGLAHGLVGEKRADGALSSFDYIDSRCAALAYAGEEVAQHVGSPPILIRHDQLALALAGGLVLLQRLAQLDLEMFGLDTPGLQMPGLFLPVDSGPALAHDRTVSAHDCDRIAVAGVGQDAGDIDLYTF